MAGLLLALVAVGATSARSAGRARAAGTAHPAREERAPWWRGAVIYEIYPRSFQDSNGDGRGDLRGIARRLGYLQWLGVDAIWIAPMYPSPQVDFGYDISNYEGVDPRFGTLADMEHLIAAAKRRHIRVILDLVLNHTSDQHPWFIAASSSRSNPKHDWYVWSDGKPGSGPNAHDGRVPPNNWVSLFGGSAWQWVPAVHQFYYHAFYRQQPDLNWRNPAVRRAMFRVMRFWLDRGVSGFRLDAVPQLFEDATLRDERPLGGVNAFGDPVLDRSRTEDLPQVHVVMRELRRLVDAYPGDRVLVGETYLPTIQDLDRWYGGARHDELQLPMDMRLGFHGNHDHLDATAFRRRIMEAQSDLHGSEPLFVFDNHDNVRSIDRYGDGVHDSLINELLGSVLLTTRATALLYYGEEIGMHTTPPARRAEVRDPIGIRGWPKEKGRDGERTPMQWTPGPQAGFSTAARTWLPIPANHLTINVATERADPSSQLNWYRRLIALRRGAGALRDGSLRMLNPDDPNVLAYLRGGADDGIVVAMNCSAVAHTVTLHLPGAAVASAPVETLLTNAPGLREVRSLRNLTLPPYATWIARLRGRPRSSASPR
ncbi:MAG: alpha-glucosidase [Gammaproteobacteria bacterium]|nr:alpha-glucosidase [Gammaproteobacteria bacterium]